MKLSLLFSGLILLVGLFFGWRDQKQLTLLQEDHHRLLKEATELGIDGEALKHGRASKQTRQRDELAKGQGDPKAVAKKMAVLVIEMKAAETSGNERDPKLRERILELLTEVTSLDAAQLKVLVAELRNNPDLDAEMRENLMSFAIMTLGETNPEAALTLYTESFDLNKVEGRHSHMISEGLNKWAQQDPMAALEWMRSNSQKYPNLQWDTAKQGILKGVAKDDPRLAFKLIDELGLKEPQQAGNAISRAAHTPEQRMAVLAALRDHLGKTTDAASNKALSDAALQGLTKGMVKEGFTAATTWLEQAQLTPQEKFTFANNLYYSDTKENTGKWLEWMAKEAPVEKMKSNIDYMVQSWTREDHKAVGTWLNQAPDSWTRQAAVHAYTNQVASYEPQTAALWAKTLPAGKERTDTMQHIYREWKKQDVSAAAAFAREQGVKE